MEWGRWQRSTTESPEDERTAHDTSRIAWAKLLAKFAETFPLARPVYGGDIRLIAFIIDPGPSRKIRTLVGEPVEPPPVSPARGPPTEWTEFVQAHDDRDVMQDSPDELKWFQNPCKSNLTPCKDLRLQGLSKGVFR